MANELSAQEIVIETQSKDGLDPHLYGVPVKLRCVRCHLHVDGAECVHCGFEMIVQGGVVHALLPEQLKHYAQFIANYERIRSAEGRGSQAEHYYLGLPYKDVTSRNSDQWRIRARSFDCLLEKILRKHDGRTILDLGAGNCWMSYRLGMAGYQAVAVDLLANDSDGLGATIHYRSKLSYQIPCFRAEAANLPFEDAQFDAVVFNASFHYAESYETVLREALRCVKNGGIVVICDTPWYKREESGSRMVAERQATFLSRYGTASDALKSLEFLTDRRLALLAGSCGIQWDTYRPSFGIRWSLRPWAAKVRGKREPSRFRIYVARKNA